MDIYKDDEERQQRLHMWLCTQAQEGIELAIGRMRKIEIERAQRYGRLDHIAREAHFVANSLRVILDDIFKIDQLIEEDMKRRK